MTRARAVSSAFAAAIAVAAVHGAGGCGGTRADAGRDAWMHVDGATFFRAPLPAPTDGPAVVAGLLGTSSARAGFVGRQIHGALGPSATAAAIALAGDRGYWVVRAGPPSVETPGSPSFAANLSFAPSLPAATYTLVVCAVDAAGHFGAPFRQPFAVTADAPPVGPLVVTLTWDTEADLDLHLVLPDGVEVWKRNINSYEPPAGSLPDADAAAAGAVLDDDSNAACVIDGRRREDVVFGGAPPRGHYVARVDTASLCAQTGARWTVEALADGVVLAGASGVSTDADTRYPHDLGAGITALEFDVP